MVDALASGASVRKDVRVQVPPRAQNSKKGAEMNEQQKRERHEQMAKRLMETRRLVDEDLGGKIFSREEVDELIKKVREENKNLGRD